MFSSRLVTFLQLALPIGVAVTTSSASTETDSEVISTSPASSTVPIPASSVSASTSSSAPSTLATATLDKAQVIGVIDGSITSFHGIPFAEPPVGDLRLRLPVPVSGYSGTIDATQAATQCVQLTPPIREDMPAQMLADMLAEVGGLVGGSASAQSEDCLTINVQVPTGTKAGDELPVIAWIFGGGFVIGSSELFPGDSIVAHSVEMGQPVIYAAMNYRLGPFGFLGGKEVKEAGVGNLGLQDQREALRWIQKHIAEFGGDPEKVTLWGPSAGAISSGLHMVTNHGNTEGLFRGAIMSAGSPLPTGDIEELQPVYDQIVDATGCAGANDTLQRDAPLSSDIMAINYPVSTVYAFQGFSQTVIESLQSASATASNWLGETGNTLSHNLDETRRIEDTIRETSIGLEETHQYTRATEAHIRTLEGDIQREHSNLESAQNALHHAKDELAKHENVRNGLRIASIATFFIPIIPAILMTIDATAMQAASEQHQRTISSIESQLSSSNSQLDERRRELDHKRAESNRLSSEIARLRREAEELSAQRRRLEAARVTVAELSQRINDCLHTVNGALSSSTTIATMGSMRNVVSGMKGVVVALGSNEMFAGPLAQLNDAALDTLDRRVAAIRRHQLTV